ncbi:FRAS1-related extracellular matrix protein 2-like isoform X1 [Dermacentor variabilis]|uniref:FRAS1-related extracellular matrix protein 2-like isoform X1 n=1 Tax=Dermacentor variabilis TaxID=34621 RepID=UPI003F5AF213
MKRRFLRWLTAVALVASAAGRPLAAADVVVRNQPLTVALGRSVFLSPSEDLRIRVAPGDRCHVHVVQAEDGEPGSALSWSRPGRLQPSSFPCGFGFGSVSYTHFGSKIAPLLDRVRLLVKYEAENETLIVPLLLSVEVSPEPYQIAVKVNALSVPSLGGESQPISEAVLSFSAVEPGSVCRVRVLSEVPRFPRFGELIGDVPAQFASCESFLQGDVRYRHTGESHSSKWDYVPFLVEVTESSSHSSRKERFHLPVKIDAGIENSVPQPTFASELHLDVSQFIMTPLTPTVLAAEDPDSESGALLFNFRTVLGPEEGHFVTTDDRQVPTTSFFQKDVQSLKIAYVPPPAQSNDRRVFRVEVEVIDPEGAASDPFSLTIVVRPTNTMAPLVTKNTGITLVEGKLRKIGDSLTVSDQDNREEVSFTVVDGMRHGSILVDGDEADLFTTADLDEGRVAYRHDGSSTSTDNIVFKMSDGRHEVEFLFPVTIYPVDDEPPLLDINTGITVRKGEDVQILSRYLSATDVDSDDFGILFELLPPFPEHGTLLMKKHDKPPDSFHWLFKDGLYEAEVTKWEQVDLLEGNLYYRHSGGYMSEAITDRVFFRLSDENEPPNESGINEFLVKILPVDDLPPEKHPDATLHLLVEEFQLTAITKKELRYRDLDTKEKELRYRITKPPFDTDASNPMRAGAVVRMDEPDTEVTEFTQAEVNHHKIGYQPPSAELGIVPRIISIDFEVCDNGDNVLPGQVFTILLQPVDNKPPAVHNRGINVAEKASVVITLDDLDATDTDTPSEELTFVLVKAPAYGAIRLAGDALDEDASFRRSDIASGQLAYENRGSPGRKMDKFELEVRDGIHRVPVTVKVHIKPHSDESRVPKRPGTVNVLLTAKEGGKVLLEIQSFGIQNMNDPKSSCEFVLTHAPRQGSIFNSGMKSNRFSLQDLLKRRVFYVHSGIETGVSGSSDIFQLSITDDSGTRRMDDVLVHVKVEPVDSMPPRILVGPSLAVPEGGRATITRVHLSATDVDTNDEEILCSIDVQPSHGYVENTSPSPGSERVQVGVPVSAFAMAEVISGWINYVQSIHRGFEPLEDNFTFVCSDGVNSSPKHKFHVQITPKNDEEPEITLDEILVSEGADASLEEIVTQAADMDKPSDRLTFRVTKAPLHGKILSTRTMQLEAFDRDDVAAPSFVVYRHDDSETTTDSFELSVSDGQYESRKQISVVVMPVDDETPRLAVNDGLEVGLEEKKAITNRVLRAEDIDSDDSGLTYIIRDIPRHGQLQLLNSTTYQPSRNLTLASNFTQQDIDNGLVLYAHTGAPGVRDLIRLDVTDGTNSLIDQYFWVTIESVDVIYPEVVNTGVRLPEGGKVTLTTAALSTTDLNSNDERLRFTITHSPAKGHLESSDAPGVIIRSFTQLDLAGNKISYVHTSKDESKLDSFEFEVSDGRNSVFRTFRIAITDVDNKKPVVFISPLRLREGAERLITPFELKADDMDTTDSGVRFRLVHRPVHGRLIMDRSREAGSFTMADLGDNRLSYSHDGSDTTRDNFTFVVSDGVHRDFYVHPNVQQPTHEPQLFPIKVVAVDDTPPQMAVNRGAFALSYLDGSRRLGFRFNSDVLRARDSDSVDARLKYVVTLLPSHGILVNRAVGNRSVVEFTQADLDNADIFYLLHRRSNATRDSFQFKVVDEGKNELRAQTFDLRWAWISLAHERLVANETDPHLAVTLRRRGHLGETAFVGISARNLSARQGTDFSASYARQVQFNPGQAEAEWQLRLLDDASFERREEFLVVLGQALMAATESPDKAVVSLHDAEDEPTLSFAETSVTVPEDSGEVLLTIRRRGDLAMDVGVLCVTHHGTASGTQPSPLESYSDYVARPANPSSLVRFRTGEAEKTCRVVIIDDSLFEEAENFTVSLALPQNGRVGQNGSIVVSIAADPKDVPYFYFEKANYEVDESAGSFEVTVLRDGPDLSVASSVTVRSKQMSPPSARAGSDYIAVGELVRFPSGSTSQTVEVVLLDDYGQPELEFIETFQLVLRAPVNGTVGTPATAVVSINDTLSDVPKMFFLEEEYVVDEEAGSLSVTVVRTGDTSQRSSVRCYTRQGSATVDLDFEERPNTDQSLIVFDSGERQKTCVLHIRDDSVKEGPEELRLALGSQRGSTAGGAMLGQPSVANIRIRDESDQPVIRFRQTRTTVKEPRNPDHSVSLAISVVRQGDCSATSVVRVYSRDGSATAGKDYQPLSQELTFHPLLNETVFTVQILYDEVKEHKEAFTLHLKEDGNRVADVKDSKMIVYIEDVRFLPAVTFPSEPVVVSLRDYDDADEASPQPIHGYPLCCISSCNPKHPDYLRTGPICAKEGINDSFTEFHWKVAAPDDSFGLREIKSKAFFAPIKAITLDSVYFSSGSRVQCATRAVNGEGDVGLEVYSAPVTVAAGLCQPPEDGYVGAEPFTARLRYTGTSDPRAPNRIQITVLVPHRDGLLPAISTRPLSNLEFALSPSSLRVGLHRCSNLVDAPEAFTPLGFITNATLDRRLAAEAAEPYQHSRQMRGESTLRFYNSLDLESCMWNWTAFYTLSELVSECGGSINHDGQALNLVQSYVSMSVPLYVSYALHSTAALGGWQHSDMVTELKISFVYNTAILWDHGISTYLDSHLNGSIYPTQMRINENGQLVVRFRTVSGFHGQYILESRELKRMSYVTSEEQPDLTFTLTLTRRDATYSEAQQEWEFVSDVAVKDYSGTYRIHLVPCTVREGSRFSEPMRCTPQEPVPFALPIHFQQVSDPVPTRFSLDTQFHITQRRDLWLREPVDLQADADDVDVSFAPGDKIYGKIMVSPLQSLGHSFELFIEKCFLCTGFDGYIPRYDPDNEDYGCIAESANLRYVIKIIDKESPSSVSTQLHGAPFNASLVSQSRDADVAAIGNDPGADGFHFLADPLFKVASGTLWFIHCVYTLRGKDGIGGGSKRFGKRHAPAGDWQPRHLSRRSVLVESIGKNGLGTNMHQVVLSDALQSTWTYRSDGADDSPADLPWLVTPSVLVAALLIALGIAVIVCRKRRSSASLTSSGSGAVTVCCSGSGKSRVCASGYVPNTEFAGTEV